MKLATQANGHPDGRLMVVTRDLSRMEEAQAAPTMQDALDRWEEVEPALRMQAAALEADATRGKEADFGRLLAAMPRSYQFLDASAFLAHNHILADAWDYARRTPADPPLMYQGLSDHFCPPFSEVTFRSAADEIDFEAEFGIITDRVPRGVTAADAMRHIRLLVLINDWSLRAFGPAEMRAGFGFLHAKPPSALSAVAVTPDELGQAWQDGRVALPLSIMRGDELFGRPHGREMSYGFHDLVAHAAATRMLCAGTVLGSGTVSNRDAAEIGSGCIAERRSLDKLSGRALTGYLAAGERVCIEACGNDGMSVFGALEQTVAIGQ